MIETYKKLVPAHYVDKIVKGKGRRNGVRISGDYEGSGKEP